MAEMVRASPYLRNKLDVVDSRKNIAYLPTNSFARVIASESHTAEGLNIHALIYDELHATKDRRLWEAVRYGGISRSQPLLCAITTAGAERSGLCWEQHEYAERVIADPSYDPQFFGYIAAASVDDDWKSPAVWAAANPSFGETMDATSFEADVREAEQSNSKQAAFKRYRLNLWCESENKFLQMDQFEKCCAPLENITSDRVWYAGLDLAQTWDCNAFVAVSRGHDDVFDVLCKFWIPGSNAYKRSVSDNVPYTEWSKDDSTGLCLTPGDVCDYDFIKRDILKFCKDRTVRRIAVDPHNSHYLVQQLQAEGLDVIGFSQGFSSMNAGCRLVETLTAQTRLRTGGNKILTWMAGNASIRENADGYIKIVKPTPNSPSRVDGIIALAMALAIAEEDGSRPPAPSPEIFVL
jgi:phage terminase large subunit-like protein